MKWLVYLLALALFVFHQDFWNFSEVKPLAFDFLPIGLAYHAAFSVACAVLMFLLVRCAWPKHLEDFEQLPSHPNNGGHH
jgi:hypothetical protein